MWCPWGCRKQCCGGNQVELAVYGENVAWGRTASNDFQYRTHILILEVIRLVHRQGEARRRYVPTTLVMIGFEHRKTAAWDRNWKCKPLRDGYYFYPFYFMHPTYGEENKLKQTLHKVVCVYYKCTYYLIFLQPCPKSFTVGSCTTYTRKQCTAVAVLTSYTTHG